jgi:hypothetical protein
MSDEITLKPRASDETPPAPKTPPQTPEQEELIASPPRPDEPRRSLYAPPPGQSMSRIRALDLPLWQSRGWMKLMAVLMILNGVVAILSIWGILFCWLPIWLGITLFSAANNIQTAATQDSEQHLQMALNKLGLFFKINGIAALVGIIIGICVFAAVFMGVIGGAALMNQGFIPR